MSYCPNCGAQLPDNANFCSACGARIDAPRQNYRQPQYQQAQQPQKMTYMDRVRQAREEQKQKTGRIKWWMWALIGIGTYILIALNPLGLS